MAGKHVSAVMNTHAAKEEPLQEVFLCAVHTEAVLYY
jgi:hypothetical protein